MIINKLKNQKSKLKNRNWKILLILCVAFVLRIWKLDAIPPHLTPDEAALGYNAYSILKTGRDEYGNFLPIIFKSFGDYKPGLYIYLVVPFVATFGLNEYAVRFPSALAGVAAVWFLQRIVFLLFTQKNHRSPITNHQSLASISAALLAINPWHIHFSRGAWEANVSLTLTLAGIYFFLKARIRHKYLLLSIASFAATLLAYQGAKLSTVLAVITLIITFWEDGKRLLKNYTPFVVLSAAGGLIIISPIIFSLFQGKTGRLEVFSIFSYERPKEYLQVILDQGGERVGSISYDLFHSEGVNFARGILGRWFNHFSGRFLFFEGDYQNPRHSIPNSGMFLLFDLVLVVAGFIALIKHKNKFSQFVFIWLILAPLPSALSRDQVQAVRSLNMVIPLVLILGFGVYSLRSMRSRFSPPAFLIGLAGLILVYLTNYIYFLDSYFVHLPIHNAKYWFYGYKQSVEKVDSVQANYKKIIFQQSYNQPYIYFLFYQKYDPAKYQTQAKLTESETGDVGLKERLDNVYFQNISWPYKSNEKEIMLVGDAVTIPEDLSQDYNLISEIRYPNTTETAFRILEVK